MDNLTHSLVGAALAESGLKKLTPLALPTMVAAANLPDVDIVTGLTGSLNYLEYHRGITHALVSIPFLSIALGAAVYGLSRLVPSLKSHRVRLVPLMLLSFLAMITHPLLDYTNSYGWRPFLPWSNKWQYGDVAFVVDPWIWAVLGGALLLSLARSKTHIIIGAVVACVLAIPVMVFPSTPASVKVTWVSMVLAILTVGYYFTTRRPTRLLAFFSLIWLGLYLGGLVLAHDSAIVAGLRHSNEIVGSAETIERVDALPQPALPLRWGAVYVTDQNYYLCDLDITGGPVILLNKFPMKAGDDAAIDAAKREPEFITFLRFARYPVYRSTVLPDKHVLVEVYDVRFAPNAARPGASFGAKLEFDEHLKRILEH